MGFFTGKQMGSNSGFGDWKISLVYPTGPNAITRVKGGVRRIKFRAPNVSLAAEMGGL